MEFGLFLPVSGRSATRRTLRDYAQFAERLGFQQLWAAERLVIPWTIDPAYPYAVGGGWMKEEFDALSAPFAERGRVSDEQLDLLCGALTEERCTFEGQHYRFRDIAFNPKGYNRTRPSIWVGGEGAAAQKRAARYGDAWFPYFVRITPADLAARWDNVQRQAEASQRYPSDIELNLNL